MFQFPGFASYAYVFNARYPIGVGCPIRTSTDQRLLAAPRGLSQRATSFIASWCQGIHRMPFSCSITPVIRLRTTRPHPPCTGTIHARNAGMNATYPMTGPSRLSTHGRTLASASNFNAPERCRKPAVEHQANPLAETDPAARPDQTQPTRNGPPLSPPKPRAIARGQETTEASCASRNAPEPDLHMQRAGVADACDRPPRHPHQGTSTPTRTVRDPPPRRAAQCATPGEQGPHLPVTATNPLQPKPKKVPDLEVIGIEPMTPCLQSRCSPS